MASWRDRILTLLRIELPGLILADDPDGLLVEEGIASMLAERCVTVVAFEDPIVFRHTWEVGLRRAAGTVLIRTGAGGAAAMPWDVLQRGRCVRVGLADVFPKLHIGTVAALGVDWLDRLAAIGYDGPPLGERETLDRVLRHVAGIDAGAVDTPERLLGLLLKRHYDAGPDSALLDAYLVEVLRKKPVFVGWPLAVIVPDREAFLRFLQERWPLFVERTLSVVIPASTAAEPDPKTFEIPGPTVLPFDHPGVRAYVDSLFLEGHLKPIEPPGPVDDAGWIEVGLDLDPERDRLRRVEYLADVLDETLPAPDAPHIDWLRFGIRWGQVMADAPFLATDEVDLTQRVERLKVRANAAFVTWVLRRYDSLRTLPASPPAMLHHVARHLAGEKHKAGAGAKVAILLLDGLAMEQWVTLSRLIERQMPDLVLTPGATFAWLPTLTAVSRQAVFTGKAPHAYADSIDTSQRDSVGWQAFWEEQGLLRSHVRYLDVKGEPTDVDSIKAVIEDDRVQAFGLVVRMIDEIVHGAELGRAGVQQSVELWTRTGVPIRILSLLLDAGFSVYLTSDHGNTEAFGIGRPEGGLLAKERAERVRVYGSASVRDQIAATVSGSIAWTPAGLPKDYHTLFPPVGKAFTNQGKRLVTHGGISIEELIVPFVHLRRAVL